MKTFFGNCKKFLKAVLGRKTRFDLYVSRLDACLSCSWNVEKKNKNYCRGCGCPQTTLWPFAELKMKAGYEYAECPRKKWK